MRSSIKTILAAAVGTAILAATPAFAQKAKHHTVPRSTDMMTLGTDPDVVTDGARYIGRDPDVNVRAELLKDDSEHNGNGY